LYLYKFKTKIQFIWMLYFIHGAASVISKPSLNVFTQARHYDIFKSEELKETSALLAHYGSILSQFFFFFFFFFT
jgi:hypothetical protein